MSNTIRIIVDAVLMPAHKLNSYGNVELVAELRGGEMITLTSFFSDERDFTPSDFIGHSLDWAQGRIRDMYDGAWGLRPENGRDAHYDSAVKRAWEERKMLAWQDGGSYDVEF